MKKDNFFDIVGRIVYPTSLYFTVFTLFLYILGAVFSSGTSNMIPTLRTVLIIFGFSLVLNLANMLLSSKKLSLPLRIAMHFVILALAFYVLVINASDFDMKGSTTMILMLVYAVIYAVICAIVLSVKSAVKKSKIEASEYKSIYDKRI